jgi:hypothetical protein
LQVIDGAGNGAYNIEIRQNSSAPLQGCLLQGTKACPSVFPFAYYSTPSTLAQCASSGSCPPSGSPAGLYSIRLMDQGIVTGCTTTSCPEAFPVAAAANNDPPVTCLSTRSQCSDVPGNYVFALFKAGTPSAGGLPTAVLDRCIPNPAGLSTCDGVTGYTGLELYNSLGALVGCTTTAVTACPPQFPFAFYDAQGALNSCRANITGICAAATGNAFPTPIFDDKVSWKSCGRRISSCHNSACMACNLLVHM